MATLAPRAMTGRFRRPAESYEVYIRERIEQF